MRDMPIILAAACLSLVLVGLVRWVALRHDLLDHPNERSSHSVATPRGGGLGLVASFVCVVLTTGALNGDRLALVCLAGLVAVAIVGWLDDRFGLSIVPRLAVHVLAACLVGAIAVRGSTWLVLTILLFAMWTFWTISSINIVNFMDGINGLVASQVLVFGISLGLLLERSGTPAILPFALAGACAGFLPWNFPCARIFLGDVGSGTLGFAVAWLGAVAVREYGIDPVRVYLPILPLFADAATTMLMRWRDGEQLTMPHRRHLYQRLANSGLGHTRVTLLYAAAALAGALVAHRRGDSTGALLTVAFVLSVGIAGVVLHRRTVLLR
jgi:UDP-N-acetylmuramyl pentapeptide phosphotransferase/UDP-N-acetylglucosamine-1-phosphate transferase